MTTANISSAKHASNWQDTVSWGDIVAFNLPEPHHDKDRQSPSGALPWLIVDEAIYVGTRYLSLARASCSRDNI